MSYHAVIRVPGRAWDPGRGTREQDAWDAHARFMDALVADGFVVLGGPLGAGDHRFLLVCDAAGPDAVRARLAADPWSDHLLEVASVEPWAIWLDGR